RRRRYTDSNHRARDAAVLAPQQLLQQRQARNLSATGGNPVIGQQGTTLSSSGEVLSPEQLRQFPVQLPSGQKVALQNLSRVSVSPVDPPDTEAIYQGQDAVVLAVSMQPGLKVQTFGDALRKRLAELGQPLPTGFTLHVATFQSSVAEHER
ncbi:efflux RND transporter permease subunit, partial [Pseudomonas syringae]